MFAAIQEVIPAIFEQSVEPLTMREARPRVKSALTGQGFDEKTLHREVYRHIHQSSINELRKRKGYRNGKKTLWNDKAAKTYRLLTAEELRKLATGETPEFLKNNSGLLNQSVPASAQKIAQEKIVRDYLATALEELEPGLNLWVVSPPSKEYLLESRRIDILARDAGGNPVVIELKLHSAHDRVVGQALLYRALVRKYHPEAQRIRIILVARRITKVLKLATQELGDVDLFEYQDLEAVQPNEIKLRFIRAR